MEPLPFAGKILVRGDADLGRTIRAWLIARGDALSCCRLVESASELVAGDLWFDLSEDAPDPSPALTWCRAHGVRFLTLASEPDALSRRREGTTSLFGVGACPSLLTHFVRIALRDHVHKSLQRHREDPRRAELLKLLRLGEFARVVPLAGVHTLELVAPKSALRGLTRLRLEQTLVTSTVTLSEREPDSGTMAIGVILHGYGRQDWWTGCHTTETAQAASVVASAVWMLQNPNQGERAAADLPYEEILEVALPYLSECESRAV